MSRNRATRLGKRQAEDMQPWLDAWPDKASCRATPSGFIFDDAHVEAINDNFCAWLDTQDKQVSKRLASVIAELARMGADAKRHREHQDAAFAAFERRQEAVARSEAEMLAWLAPLSAAVPALWEIQKVTYKPQNARTSQVIELEFAYNYPTIKRPVVARIVALSSSAGLHWQVTFMAWTHLQIIGAPVLCDTLADALKCVAAYQVQQ